MTQDLFTLSHLKGNSKTTSISTLIFDNFLSLASLPARNSLPEASYGFALLFISPSFWPFPHLFLINSSRRSQDRLISYPHGFLDVVLSDDLSRAIHVPLQTSNQLSAKITRLNITCNYVGIYIFKITRLAWKNWVKCCTCMLKLQQSGFGCRSPWRVWSGRNGCPWAG